MQKLGKKISPGHYSILPGRTNAANSVIYSTIISGRNNQLNHKAKGKTIRQRKWKSQRNVYTQTALQKRKYVCFQTSYPACPCQKKAKTASTSAICI